MRIDFRHIVIAFLALSGCRTPQAAPAVNGGDPGRGMAAVSRFGCGSCHTIAGIPGAHGLVGPPLTGISKRVYIAGMLVNTPQTLIQWISDPHSVNAQTAMPNVGLTMRDAADIAAFLYAKN